MSEEIRSDPAARGGDVRPSPEPSRSFEVRPAVADDEDDADWEPPALPRPPHASRRVVAGLWTISLGCLALIVLVFVALGEMVSVFASPEGSAEPTPLSGAGIAISLWIVLEAALLICALTVYLAMGVRSPVVVAGAVAVAGIAGFGLTALLGDGVGAQQIGNWLAAIQWGVPIGFLGAGLLVAAATPLGIAWYDRRIEVRDFYRKAWTDHPELRPKTKVSGWSQGLAMLFDAIRLS